MRTISNFRHADEITLLAALESETAESLIRTDDYLEEEDNVKAK